MNKSKILFSAPLAMLALVGCNSTTPASTSTGETSATASSSSPAYVAPMKIVSPVGAPTLALYDQGANANWTSTSDTSIVGTSFKTSTDVGAMIFDGVNGLTALKGGATKADFRLAKWLTGGNFHLVSTKHTKEEALTSASLIESFSEKLLPNSVFHRLASDYWKVDLTETNIHYEAGVSAVSTVLASSPDTYDYYFIAEPALTAAKTQLAAKNPSVTVNEIYNLRSEWKAYSGQAAIPQAALFVNKTLYDASKADYDAFLEHIDNSLTKTVSAPDEVAKVMDANQASKDDQVAKFGFNSVVAAKVQKNDNGFGMVLPSDISDDRTFVNEFETKMGSTVSFDTGLFLS
jgi:hypothetical protein